ncbi:MAG: sensor histidine kinase [Burkholderiaceae bacterium]
MPRRSLARHLVIRLFPAVLILVAIDISLTWIMTQRMSLEAWLSRDIFWSMVISQVFLISLFAWVLVSGVRSGLSSINRLSTEINQRSVDDLHPLDPAGLPVEVAPLVTHFNDLLLRLDDAMQGQKRFIGHAAHQLRTPLAGLKLESELMLNSNIPDDVRARAERIKAVTDRMIRVGQQLLVLARVDPSVRPQDSFERIDLGEWVRVTGAEWIPQARKHAIQLDVYAPEQPVWVDADPLLLEELLGNLVDNAFRYATGATHITLSVGANPPTLTVQDNGAGILESDVGKVFEAFYRSSQAASGGAGLGLPIVREIARAHGAWWSLSTRPQIEGTRVVIVMPGPRRGARLRRAEDTAAVRAAG